MKLEDVLKEIDALDSIYDQSLDLLLDDEKSESSKIAGVAMNLREMSYHIENLEKAVKNLQ